MNRNILRAVERAQAVRRQIDELERAETRQNWRKRQRFARTMGRLREDEARWKRAATESVDSFDLPF